MCACGLIEFMSSTKAELELEVKVIQRNRMEGR